MSVGSRKWLSCLFPLLVLINVACFPEFENPIPESSSPRIDRKIVGTWVSSAESEKVLVAIFPSESQHLDVVYVENDNDPEVYLFEGYNTSIKRQRFLCLKQRAIKDISEGSENYIIAHYDASRRGRLVISFFSNEKINDMIRSGELDGEVGKGLSDAVVTSSSEELISLIVKKGLKAFVEEEEGVLRLSRPNR